MQPRYLPKSTGMHLCNHTNSTHPNSTEMVHLCNHLGSIGLIQPSRANADDDAADTDPTALAYGRCWMHGYDLLVFLAGLMQPRRFPMETWRKCYNKTTE